MAQGGMKVKYKGGRIRTPKLTDPALIRIGNATVAEQKARWAKGMSANGVPAKKLSVRYAIIKQQKLHKRPIRDNQMTGALIANFSLRKATNDVIRAENTTRMARQHANQSQQYEEMIGFALTDARVVIAASQKEYGAYVEKAFIPLGDTIGRPY